MYPKINLKHILLLFAVFTIIIILPTRAHASSTAELDESQSSKGYITISLNGKKGSNYVVVIEKEKKSTYVLEDDGKYPLTEGDGTYKILVGEKVEGKGYLGLLQKSIKVKIADEAAVYLQSNDLIDWENADSAILTKAKELTKQAKTNMDKAKAIHEYIIKNYTYDNKKASSIESDYTPNASKFFKDKSGICYDYATLAAVMLRSVGVPTKLAKGYETSNSKVYHAWNEVYDDALGEWITIDTTFDSANYASGKKVNFEKDSNHYTTDKAY